MKYFIHFLTDNNRKNILIKVDATDNTTQESHLDLSNKRQVSCSRLVYQEIHETENAAIKRLEELNEYTRMQLERLIRSSNPNWVNLLLMRDTSPEYARPSFDRKNEKIYQPGAKLRPNVPNFTSLR